MKKKQTTTIKVPTPPAAPARRPVVDLGTATPDTSVALRLVLDRGYTLLGYYAQVAGNGGAVLVSLQPRPHDPDPAKFGTYEVTDARKGACILPHYFGQDQFEEARSDFMRRSFLEILNSRRR